MFVCETAVIFIWTTLAFGSLAKPITRPLQEGVEGFAVNSVCEKAVIQLYSFGADHPSLPGSCKTRHIGCMKLPFFIGGTVIDNIKSNCQSIVEMHNMIGLIL